MFIFLCLIFCFACLFLARKPFRDGNTIFGDLAESLGILLGYVGFFGGAIFLWLIYEDQLYTFWPWGLVSILLPGGWAAGWFSKKELTESQIKDIEYRKKNAESIHKAEVESYNQGLLILISFIALVWFFFFR